MIHTLKSQGLGVSEIARLLHHAIVIQIEGASYRLRAHSDLLLDCSVGQPLSAAPKKRRGRPPISKKEGLVYNLG